MDIKVSLIIPVYNVEKYVRKCLVCAVNQTLEDIEIIVVNDGSTDKSEEIIKEFTDKYDNITVITQKNAGLSAARNAGIAVAKGKYIAFADSDDYFDFNFLKNLYDAVDLCNGDIGVCKFKRVKDKTKKRKSLLKKRGNDSYKVVTSEKALNMLIRDIKIRNYAWDKIYKRDLFVENNILYPVGRAYEDLGTTYKLFYYAKNVVLTYNCSYYYLQRKNSITNNFSCKHAEDIADALLEMKNFFTEKNVYQKYKKSYNFLCLKNLNFIRAIYLKNGLGLQKSKEISDKIKLLLDKEELIVEKG